MTLDDLDKAFIDLWMHPNQLPALLDKWQEMVSEYLAEIEQTEAFVKEYETYLHRWQLILAKNRELMAQEQNGLKSQLKTGEMKVDPTVIARKFRSE
ncbi:MAG: hypothetical protein P8X74_09625 [Reinekea sp.]